VIVAINEHGGCDLHPKPTKIEQGVLSEDFTAEEKEKLIEVSLKEIQSACRNQSSIDWPLFAKRMDKMELFLKYFDFSRAKSLAFASSYIDAVRLLYRNGQGDIWFSKGEELAKSVVDDYQAKDRSNGKATDEGLSGVYETYATLFMERFDKTKDNRSLDAAFGAFGKAIGFDPQDVTAYKNRGNAYRRKGDWDRAIADYDKSISLEPNDVLWQQRQCLFEQGRLGPRDC
jgi:tetratricopeptide (TPR) repeat protein